MSHDTNSPGSASFARGVAQAVLIPGRFFVDGWALWQLWAWFIVPIGVRPLALWQAVGIDTLIGLFIAHSVTHMEPDADKRFILFLARSIAAPAAVLAGWVALLLWRHT